jgi:hypothetical protein
MKSSLDRLVGFTDLGCLLPCFNYRRVRTVFFAGAFTDFFAAFLAAVFVAGELLAAVFLTAFLAGAFLAALFATALLATFFRAFFAGVSALETVVTAAPTDVSNGACHIFCHRKAVSHLLRSLLH